MRVAALYDVHGNLPALEAVLAEVERERFDAVVCGGDVVWGPFPSECLRRLESLGARFVRGNAEREVLAAADERDAWCRERLSEEQRELIATWPATLALGDVLFCHGSPRRDDEILTRLSPDERVREAVAGVTARIVVCGHTHRQFDRRVDGVRVVNAGSVGLPYEGERGAFWAIVGDDVELRRTAYDVEAAIERLVASGFPDARGLLQESLVEPAPPDEVAAHFESRAA